MTGRNLLICLVALAGAGLHACAHDPLADNAPQSLLAYEWLLGDWHADAGQQLIYEQWRRSGPQSFAGIGGNENRDTGERRVSEHIDLLARDGKIFYVPTVAHNPAPVVFALVSTGNDRLVFVNSTHDFPKTIVYQRVDQNHFRAEVSDGGSRGFVLEFMRITQEAPDASTEH